MYNQAGIIAINVLGHPLPADAGLRPQVTSQNASFGLNVDKVKVPPLEDLAFEMNFDPITAEKIRQVHAAKERGRSSSIRVF